MDINMPEDQSPANLMKTLLSSKGAATSLRVKHKILKRSPKNSTKKTSNENNDPRITSKDQKKHKLVLRDKIIPDGVELHYKSKGKKLLAGLTKGRGILCGHCNKVVSATMFESHAGKSNSKKPYQHIYLFESKMSLHQYAYYLKRTCQERVENNDLLCLVCQKSGDLVFCDRCPRSFHQECMYDTIFTTKKHFCILCQLSMKRLVPKANSVKGGTVSGLEAISVKDGTVFKPKGKSVNNGMVSRLKGKAVHDGTASGSMAIEKTADPGIQIDDPFEKIACVLCRSAKYTGGEVPFNDLTSIVCEQCEKEYHIGCLKKDMNVVLTKLPADEWYCSKDCKSLHSLIKLLVESGPLKAKELYMEIAREKLKGCDADDMAHADMRWFAFTNKGACAEHKKLIPKSIDIFKECFNPIIDVQTNLDFITEMANGNKMGPFNFFGVYNALLTVNHKVVTAGMFRVYGREFAELPLVGTSQLNRGKGFFQAFMVCFERLLSMIRVKKIVIPAATDATNMWIKKFGFTKIPPKMLAYYRETYTSMVAFEGTILLQRDVPQGIVSSM